jgi:ketosteroid isomerase-like protein
MTTSESVAIVMDAFRAVEEWDDQRLFALYHPEVEFLWPPSLPFGGTARGGVKDRPGPGWSEVWRPLQPTEAERRMDPRVVAATEKEVVVQWHQRAVSPSGERFDGEALGLYGVRDGKFARAQMFYFDAIAVQRFLTAAGEVAGRLAAGGTATREGPASLGSAKA